MLLQKGTKILDLKKYFKSEFEVLLVYDGPPNKILLSKNKTSSLELTQKTTIRDIEKFFKQFNVSVEIYNSSGTKVAPDYEISAIKSLTEEKLELGSVKKNIKLISSLKNSTEFQDIDWIYRIYNQIIYDTETDEDKKLVIESLKDTLATNSKFTQDDYEHFVNQLN